MKLSIIAAYAENRVIGRDNQLPWRLPDDLKRFKALTMGHCILMGRRTFESLGKPLPGRRSIVITRQRDYRADGAEVVHSLDEALERARGDSEPFVIGGAEIFQQALPRAERLYLTLVHASLAGDTLFPELDWSRWNLVDEARHPADKRHEHPFSFRNYERVAEEARRMSQTSTGCIVVTGASTGIGRACAIELDKLGHRVFAGVRRESDADSLRSAASDRLTPVFLDVTDPASIQTSLKTVQEAASTDGLLGLVNNAGIGVVGPIEYIDVDELRRQFEVNLFGQVSVTQAFMPLLRQRRGRIVNISSIGGKVTNPMVGPYCASKYALEAISDALRQELAPWGMHVAVVEPGTIDTPIFDKTNSDADKMLEGLSEEARTRYLPIVEPLRATVDKNVSKAIPPERVANAVIHALTANRPKTRYLVGPDAKVQAALRAVLPDRWMDAVTARFIGLPKRLD